jgi:hypothetical protein
MVWESRTSTVTQICFASWLLLTIAGYFWDNYSKQNKNYLLIGGVLSLAIPITNGMVTGHWFWQVWDRLPRVAFIDVFWLGAGITAIVLATRVLKIKEGTDIPQVIELKNEMTEKQKPTKIKNERPKLGKPSFKPQLAVSETIKSKKD